MTMCRRIIILIFISIRPEQSIFVLSLITFNTLLIAINAIWNQPYKIYDIVLPTI
jgi:hypothetical protein